MIDSIISVLTAYVQQLMTANALGFLLGMIAGTSVVPIPSESILVGLGLLGFDPTYVAIVGGIGSTIGGTIAYWIGKRYGRFVVDKFGKYFFLTQDKLDTMDKWANRFGSYTVLLSRLIPIVPFKIFSIFAGITKIDFKNYVIMTFIGSIPRCFVLAYFGNFILSLKNLWLVALSIIFVFAFPLIFSKLVDLTRS